MVFAFTANVQRAGVGPPVEVHEPTVAKHDRLALTGFVGPSRTRPAKRPMPMQPSTTTVNSHPLSLVISQPPPSEPVQYRLRKIQRSQAAPGKLRIVLGGAPPVDALQARLWLVGLDEFAYGIARPRPAARPHPGNRCR